MDMIFIVFTGVFVAAMYTAYRFDAFAIAGSFAIGIVLLIIMAVKIKKQMPTSREYEYFDYYLSENRYNKINFKDLELSILEESHYLSKKGSLSALYSNPARKVRCIAALTPPDGRNKYSILPEYVVFMVEGGNRYCQHCLAFVKRSRENTGFSIIYGKSFHVFDGYPTIQFYSVENSIPEQTTKTISGILERLNSPVISIECVDRWILLAIPRIPNREQLTLIIDNLETII